MNVSTSDNSPLPPPSSGAIAAESPAAAEGQVAEPRAAMPVMPAAGSNRLPQLTGANPQAYVAPKVAGRSRSRVYGIGAIVFISIALAGYFGFRSYIYGDDAPPLPVLDDLGD